MLHSKLWRERGGSGTRCHDKLWREVGGSGTRCHDKLLREVGGSGTRCHNKLLREVGGSGSRCCTPHKYPAQGVWLQLVSDLSRMEERRAISRGCGWSHRLSIN